MSSNPTKYDFSGKVGLVTGSSAGIGAAIATQFAQYGANVTIHGRNVENLEKVANQMEEISGKRPHIVAGDLVTDDSLSERLINETVEKFGRLDFLVNNAGITTASGNLAHSNMLEEFDRIFKMNVRTVVELMQRAMPHLEKTQGNIVNISSTSSLMPHQVVYCSSKAALDMVTKTAALELGPKGIRVNSINPGYVKMSLFRINLWGAEKAGQFYQEVADKSLLKRCGEAGDIANLTSFLVSDDARNITGSIYVTDSGCMLAPPQLTLDYIKEEKKKDTKI